MLRKVSAAAICAIVAVICSCGNSQQSAAGGDSATAVVQKLPESTDSTANGLHPHYPTEQNILGKWILPDPTDTVPHLSENFIEFLADHSVSVSNKKYVNPVKWELSGNILVMTHESGDPIETGRMLNDTLVLEAVTDTSVHYFNLHEPNFIMHLKRKK